MYETTAPGLSGAFFAKKLRFCENLNFFAKRQVKISDKIKPTQSQKTMLCFSQVES
jgi:hypothetical protein